MNATGWMPDDILDRLTWQDFVDLTGYWVKHPPIQEMVQARLGYKAVSQSQNDAEFDALVAQHGSRQKKG